MISIWWLLLIVPVCFVLGLFLMAVLASGACADCRDAMRYREDLVANSGELRYQEGFEIGFQEGLRQVGGVG